MVSTNSQNRQPITTVSRDSIIAGST